MRPLLFVAFLLGSVALPVAGLAQDQNVDEILAGMSLEEKVGQVLLVGVAGKQIVDSHDAAHVIRQMHVGGVILLGRNVRDPIQLARLNRDLQELAPKVPLFIALDQEGGTVIRLRKGATLLPGNMALGATRSRSLSYLAGRVTGAELFAVGVNMNLAPVLDVNSNPDNPVIGVRAYGDSVNLVSELGSWYIRGLQEMGVVAVAKHFPGHGETEADSHFGLTNVPRSRKQIMRVDIPPFRNAMNLAGLDAVMSAHVRYPAFDGPEGPPATMSKALLTGLLRDELDFKGLLVTDDLEMASIRDTVGVGQGAVNSLKAGADVIMVIWHRESKIQAQQALLNAIKSGELSQERLDMSVHRILSVKKRRGILDVKPPDPEVVNRIVGHPHHIRIADEIARRSVTVVADRQKLLPLLIDEKSGVMVIGPKGPFIDEIKSRHPRTFVLPVVKKPNPAQTRGAIRAARRYAPRVEKFVVVIRSKGHAEIANELARRTDRPVIAVALGSPYHLDGTGVDAYISAYSNRDESGRAAARMLLGAENAHGKSPVIVAKEPKKP